MARKQLSTTMARLKARQRSGGIEKASHNNAFNEIRTRKKFTMIGRKLKGDAKRTTQKRSAAVEKVRLLSCSCCDASSCTNMTRTSCFRTYYSSEIHSIFLRGVNMVEYMTDEIYIACRDETRFL